jgi:hypothetical protein
MPISTEDPPRSLVLNVCGDMIHRTCANKPDKRGVLHCLCGVADDNVPLLPLPDFDDDEGNQATTSAILKESGKRPSLENTSSRKKAKRALHESPMLKKLIIHRQVLLRMFQNRNLKPQGISLNCMTQLSMLRRKSGV